MIALVVIWAVAAVIDVVVAADHIHHGEAAVQSARQGLSADAILSGAPAGSLRSAQSSFSSAHALLSLPLLWPVDILPVAGRQLRSVQDLSGAAEQVAHAGVGAVGQSQSLLRLPHSAGPQRVAVLQQLASLAASTHHSLAGVDLGPVQGLIGPLAHERNTFAGDLAQIQTTLARTSDAASSAATILQGPATYLLLAGNNAEMRSGSGAFLEAGVVTTGDGELHLSGMVPTTSITVAPGAVNVTGDLAARWGWLLPGVDWRNLGLTPQFDVNGPLAASMWKASTGQTVDGVLAIDVQGLQELLEVTGPVTTSTGQVVSASTVDQLLLHDQYVGETYTSNPANRVDELSTLASATLHALENQPLKLHAMADALSAAAEGRHVLLWSADPTDRGRLERCRRGRPAGTVLPDGRHHQPGREQTGPVPLGERLSAAHPSGGPDRREPHDDVLQPHPAGTVALHRRALSGPRNDLRPVRGDRHRQPPGLRPGHHLTVGKLRRGERARGADHPRRSHDRASSKARRSASPSTSCCPRPTAP